MTTTGSTTTVTAVIDSNTANQLDDANNDVVVDASAADADVNQQDDIIPTPTHPVPPPPPPSRNVTTKKPLSKWIQRLIHPELRSDDVIVIQSPEIIPLNDTFILDFGRRIRDDEMTFGIPPLHIDPTISDMDDDIDINNSIHNDQNNVATMNSSSSTTKTNPSKNNKKLPRKVKITNIKYTTTATMMEQTLEEQFGPIEYMNLIMQSPSSTSTTDTSTTTNQPKLNSGLAYVTFVDPDAAQQCVTTFNTLDHRPVSVTLLTNINQNQSATAGAGGAGGNSIGNSNTASNRRYWSEIDLSISCYTCGQTGHRSYECTGMKRPTETTVVSTIPLVTPRTTVLRNGKKPRRPCPLCANTTDHSEIFKCPDRNVCFNCGIPGHISRECTQRRLNRPYNNNNNNNNMINRCVCTICYTMNHHTKYNCPWTTRNSQQDRNHKNYRTTPLSQQVHPAISTISADAKCASCGRTGHFLCQELKWFYGLNDVSCCNCGMPGHISTQCPRPNLEVCSRNEETVLMEIERASTVRSVEQSIFDANSTQPQSSSQKYRTNPKNASQHQPNDNSRNHHRRDGAAAVAGQSRYGSIDRSRHNNSSSNHNNSNVNISSAPQYERGRSTYRPPEQPHFRPFKSMPPPKRQNHSQPNNQNDNNNNSSSNRSGQQQNHKRNRNAGGGNQDTDIPPPQQKRRRPN